MKSPSGLVLTTLSNSSTTHRPPVFSSKSSPNAWSDSRSCGTSGLTVVKSCRVFTTWNPNRCCKKDASVLFPDTMDPDNSTMILAIRIALIWYRRRQRANDYDLVAPTDPFPTEDHKP